MTNHKITLAAAVATLLASLALYPIFSGPSWFWSGAGAVIAVAIGGTLTRIRRISPVLCLLGTLVVLVLYLNMRFESARSLLLVLPTPSSLSGLWHDVGQGFSDASAFAPPVEPTRGLLLLASLGIGFTATLVDLIAARLRSAAIAGLPLLMLFTEPFAVNVSRGSSGTAIVFCLGAAGYLGLLSVDGRSRIKSWGRIAGPGFLRADTTALATTGRRVGLASVVVALCVPLLVPGLHAARLFEGTWTIGGSNGGGSQTVTLPSPVTELHAQLTEPHPQVVLQYQTSDQDAGTQYLQEYALNNLTSSGWEFNQQVRTFPVSPDLPAAPGLNRTATPATANTTSITFAPNVSTNTRSIEFLPLPYPSLTLNASGSWLSDPQTLMTMAHGIKLSGFSYQVSSLHLEPNADELGSAPAPPASVASLTNVPNDYDSLAQLAASITRDQKTELGKAEALLAYFDTGDFTYTLNAPTVTDAASLATFLQNKRGYCEQFAFAMTVLARLSGIPTRYAVGYTAGQRQRNNTWVVRTSDAHAWPELYFSGVGWLRFEPTPAGPFGQGTATSPSYSNIPPTIVGAPGPGSVATTQPSQQLNPQAGHGRHRISAQIHGSGFAGPTGETVGPGGARRPSSDAWLYVGLALLALLALILALLALPSLIRVAARRMRWRGTDEDPAAAARAAWSQFLSDLADHHHGARPSESPRTLAARLTTELSLTTNDAEAVQRLALAAERMRYSATPANPEGLREDTTAARHAITFAATRRERWLARLLPASVLIPAMASFAKTLDRLTHLPRLPRPARLSRPT